VNYDDHLVAIEREVIALVEAFAAGSMTAPVPTCPEWTARDLAEHVGDFCGFWAHVICEGTGRPKPFLPAMPAEDGVPEWIGHCGGILLAELSLTEPGHPMWSWVTGQEHAAFAARRAANELAIHRFDTQSAHGTSQPIDGTLAVDGIEEIFVMAAAWNTENEQSGRGQGETLCLVATDQEAAWRLKLTPMGTRVTRSPGAADVSISGCASDLELLLYARPTIRPLTQNGDPSALGAWYKAFHFG
jgi:hypothetical protein